MKVRLQHDATTYYGGFTVLNKFPRYLAIDIAQVQMWHLDDREELHIFFSGKKKGLLLTKNSPEVGGEANFNALLRLLAVEFEDVKVVFDRLEKQHECPELPLEPIT